MPDNGINVPYNQQKNCPKINKRSILSLTYI
ncbi:unknown [Prevotella sp. CAG:604]|nr:unknown [Prevotella sp. CAG:604]